MHNERWPCSLCILLAALKHPGSEVASETSFIAVFQCASYIYNGSRLGKPTRTGQG